MRLSAYQCMLIGYEVIAKLLIQQGADDGFKKGLDKSIDSALVYKQPYSGELQVALRYCTFCKGPSINYAPGSPNHSAKGACIANVYLVSDIAFHDRRIPLPVFDLYGVGQRQAFATPNMSKDINLKIPYNLHIFCLAKFQIIFSTYILFGQVSDHIWVLVFTGNVNTIDGCATFGEELLKSCCGSSAVQRMRRELQTMWLISLMGSNYGKCVKKSTNRYGLKEETIAIAFEIYHVISYSTCTFYFLFIRV